jgi:hypothetical protein
MTRARVACGLLAAGLLISACGSGGGGGGEAGKSADQVLADAVAAMKSLHSLHIDAHETASASSASQFSNLGFSVDVAAADSAQGTVTANGVTAAFVFSGGKLYFKGRAFFAKLASAALAQVIGDRWVIVPSSSGIQDIEQLVNPGTLGDCLNLDHGTLSKGGTATVDGQATVVLIDRGEKPGTQPAKLYVAADGTAYLLRRDLTGKATPGNPPGGPRCGSSNSDNPDTGVMTFSQFNASFTVGVPKDAVDLQSLMGGG